MNKTRAKKGRAPNGGATAARKERSIVGFGGPLIVFGSGAVVFALALAPYLRQRALVAPLPADLSTLEAALRETIETHVQAAREQPDNPEPHGRLGILYEAHGYPTLALRCYRNAVAADRSIPRWQYHMAVLAGESGDISTALNALPEVIAKSPDYAPARERLGLILLDQQAYAEAAEEFERVVQLRPAEAPGYVGLARAYFGMDRDQDAVALLRKAIRVAPNDPRVHYLLGRGLRGVGRLAEANVHFARGGETQPAFVQDPWRSAVAGVRMTRWVRLGRAEELMAAGQVSAAAQLLEKLLADYPDRLSVLNKLVMAYSRLGRHDDAKRLLFRALDLSDDHAPTHINFAALLANEDDLETALQHAEHGTRLAPNNALAFSIQGKLLMRLRRHEASVTALQRALELDPSIVDVRSDIGLSLTRSGRFGEAIEAFREAVAFRPDEFMDWYRLGLVLSRTGQLDEARTSLERALELDPGNEMILGTLSRVMARLSHG